MQFEAMEWDHKIEDGIIRWVVMECSGITMHAGHIQAVKPRRDVAYFVDEHTAEAAAKEFARLKNAQVGREVPATQWHGKNDTQFISYEWDHHAGRELVHWGMLRWKRPGKRVDIAYFLDPQTAEADAKMLEATLSAPAAVAAAESSSS